MWSTVILHNQLQRSQAYFDNKKAIHFQSDSVAAKMAPATPLIEFQL